MSDDSRAIVSANQQGVVASVSRQIVITEKLLASLLSVQPNNRALVANPKNTMWLDGKVDFGNIQLPSELSSAEGIIALPAVLSTTCGPEIILVHIDHSSFVHKLAKLSPYQLMLKTGAVKTNFGPLMFLLFYVPDPFNPHTPFSAVDCHINPTDIDSMAPWYGLANQTHWHYFIIDKEHDVQNFYEFENVYNLDNSLQKIEKMCKGMPIGDFEKVKADFCATYSLNDLYNM